MRPFSPEDAVFLTLARHGALEREWATVLSSPAHADGGPATFLFNGDHLAALRSHVRSGETDATSLIEALSALGTSGMAVAPTFVVDKAAAGPSGSMHDYVSLAKYWWPSPDSPTGLPYSRRDGEVNPECYSDQFDAERLDGFVNAVVALAVSGYILDERPWLEEAARRLVAWFVDEATRQTPHFAYAQLVPGRSKPRASSTIESRRLLYVCDAVRILESCDLLLSHEVVAIERWFSDLIGWLVGSESGHLADAAQNNLTAWYHVQLLVYAMFTGDQALAERELDRADALIRQQVEPDGSMPAEASRANPADYLCFAFVAMAMLAHGAERAGKDLWGATAGDGRGLSMALEWLSSLSLEGRSLDPSWTFSGDVASEAATGASHAITSLTRRISDARAAMVVARDARIDALEQTVARQQLQIESLASQPSSGFRPSASMGRGAAGGDGRRRSATWAARVQRSARRRLRSSRPYWAARRLSDERPPPPTDGPGPQLEERLLSEYRASGLKDEPQTFVLYRILGNDLPPRHRHGQTRANLQFILEHEPPLSDCSKRWVVNRIADPVVEAEIVSMLEAHQQPFLRIPFSEAEYGRVGFDLDRFPTPDLLNSPLLAEFEPDEQERALVAAYRLKNLYAMNNNGARNAALTDGRDRAKWILPFDGSTFVTTAAWAAIRAAVNEAPHRPYVVIPMARVVSNDLLLDPDAHFSPTEEPQLGFRRDARECFDESIPYGRRPKVDLFWRLGVPGPWRRWSRDPWDAPFPEPSPEHGAFISAGWIARLSTGSAEAEATGVEGLKQRGARRQTAIVEFLRGLDARRCLPILERQSLTMYDDDALASLAHGAAPALSAAIRAEAEAALIRGPYAVTDKTSLPPSGDPHDYWHPAPYWWPNPRTRDGLPYVRRDGQRVPGTRMFSTESERFDRTRLHAMFHDATVSALGWAVSGDSRYAEHGAALVRRWFVETETAMTPHLRYAQVRIGHAGNSGQASGLIEMKDVYYFLDAVRLLERSGALSSSDRAALRRWLRSYLTWLVDSPQGSEERQAANNHGTCYDLQTMAITAYLEDAQGLVDAVRRANGRLGTQFDPDGRQPHEVMRAESRHYCAFNLQSWLNLARLSESRGQDLWRRGPDGAGTIGRAIQWYLDSSGSAGWPYPETQEFDERRDVPLATALLAIEAVHAGTDPLVLPTAIVASPAVLHPHDGVPPFWQLAIGPWASHVSSNDGSRQPDHVEASGGGK